jgi:hypothetical protein
MSMTEPTEEGWDAGALNREFLARAENSERYLKEVETKLRLNRSYEVIYDQTMAEFYVFNYFHGRSFLLTRESFLAALREFVESDVAKPPLIFDFNRFLGFRKNIARGLIERFEHK